MFCSFQIFIQKVFVAFVCVEEKGKLRHFCVKLHTILDSCVPTEREQRIGAKVHIFKNL